MTTLNVGATQQYHTIAAAVAAAQDGDTVAVQAGTYTNDFATVTHKVTLQAVGGMVNMVATAAPTNGKAILTIDNDAVVDGFSFSGAAVADGNGAGIRYEAGNLTVRNSLFHDNQDGLLANPNTSGSITIVNSEFAHNGAGDGKTHNLYVGQVGSLTIQNSYFHDAVGGHEVKSRALSTTITGSRIEDGGSSTAAYAIDLPNGGAAKIQNNTIEKGAQSTNPVLIAYGEEGSVISGSSLIVSNNTILNDKSSASSAAVWNATSATASLTSNAIYGLTPSQYGRGTVSASGNTTLSTEPGLVTTSPMVVPSATTSSSSNSTTTLTLHLSEDAWQGDAQFIVSVDGKQLGAAQSVTASHAAGQSQAFTFSSALAAGSHDLAVSFTNDAWGGTASTDRNLYVNGLDVNGSPLAGATAAMYSTSTQHFAFTLPSS